MRSKQQSGSVSGIIRQGDVLLVPVEGLPARRHERVVNGPRIVLAEGEATGHAHVVHGRARLVHSTTAPLWIVLPDEEGRLGVGRTHLVVEEPAALVHDEHDRIEVAPGTYEVRRQREYAPPVPARQQDFRWVAD